MLNLLKIKNIALIDECVIEFKNGLNTLTGETGAGKSIIIDSLNFVLGARGDKSLIKYGTEQAKVEAVFETNSDEVFALLDDYGIERENTIILSRTLNVAGKNECRLNGEIITLNMLKKIAECLVDVFGQNDQLFLLNTKQHVYFLDCYGGKTLDDSKVTLGTQLAELKKINVDISSIGGDGAERERNIDLLKYQINEIIASDLKDGEEESLTERKNILLNSEKIIEKFNELDSYTEGTYNVLSGLKGVKNTIGGLTKYIPELEELYCRLESSVIDVEDVLESIGEYKNNFDYSENELDFIEQRLDTIKSLKRKYGSSIAEIFEYLSNAELNLKKLENATEELENLKNKKQTLLFEILDTCKSLTAKRKQIAVNFENKIMDRLKSLGMKSTKFKVNFADDYNIENIESKASKNGADTIEFLFSANLGEPLKPLVKIISGGELSRFMLAFKTVANADFNKTYVFDEIDTGIGGEIGGVVGEQMSMVSKKCQVLCVTHLAQIACFADNNLKISKFEQNGRTYTMVKPLESAEKINEIARMVGSDGNSEYANLYANELINSANNYKKNI